MIIPRTILQGWTVVIVDDDAMSLDISQKLLSWYGAKTYTAVNGQEGLAKVKEVNPSFVLTDISMPVMDGWDLIREMKAERSTAEIPIIALTAHAMQGDREKAIAAGCHNYLAKPLTPATFMHNLVAILIAIPIFKERIAI